MNKNVYRASLRDTRFLMWDVLGLESHPIMAGTGRTLVDAVLDRARDFSYETLGPLYQLSDRQGCVLDGGRVRLPEGFDVAWAQFRNECWTRIGIPEHDGGLGLPYVASVAVQELFYGANPAFMTLSGFALPLYFLIQRYGSPALNERFSEPLLDNRFTACLCMTEPQAGSDVGAVATRAHLLGGGRYRIEGSKVFISAGSHELSNNIVYVVLARVVGAPPGTQGLSCFLVPRFDLESGADNFVRCRRLEEKMGLHGCPTAEMSFGEDGDCIGELLGEVPNRGLLQLLTMMNHARLATGVFALGMASSAYLNAAEYAAQRLQGTDPRQVFNAAAPRVAIIQHGDVARMLVEMKTLVEGSRALIISVAAELSRVQWLRSTGGENSDISHAEGLVGLLTPVIKAHVSDASWRVAELAIQTHGGYGYVRDYPVEQYARDIKILSIWEGTNHIQAVDLLRDKLGFGRATGAIDLLTSEIDAFLASDRSTIGAELGPELLRARNCFVKVLGAIREMVSQKRMDVALLHANSVLRITAEMVVAWLLLRSASIAEQLLSLPDSSVDRDFYEGKILSARWLFTNSLPRIHQIVEVVCSGESSALSMGSALLADIDDAQGRAAPFRRRAAVSTP